MPGCVSAAERRGREDGAAGDVGVRAGRRLMVNRGSLDERKKETRKK